MNKFIALVAAYDFGVIAASLVLFNTIQPGFEPWVANITLSAAYSYIALFMINNTEMVKGIKIRLSIEFAFSLFYFILFFWPYQKEILNIGSHYYESYYVSKGYANGANKAMLISIAGLAAFHFGSSVKALPHPARNKSIEPVHGFSYFDAALSIILPIFFVAFIASGAEPDDLARYGRLDLGKVRAASPVENGLYLLTIVLCLVGVARITSQLYFGRKLKMRHWGIISAIICWMFYILILGDRNNFLVIVLGAFGGFAAFLREIKWPIIIVSVIPALLTYSTIEVYRQISDKSLAGLLQAYTDANNREDDSNSFALTTLTLRATFDIVPEPEPFALGYYKLVGFGGVFPFVRGLILGNGNEFSDTSQVISYYVLGRSASWSLGSNPISDLYLDFGQAGVVVGLALLGYIVAAVRNSTIRNGPSSSNIFLYIVVLAMMSEVPRYTIDFPVRVVVWGYLVFWLHDKLYLANFHRRSPQGRQAVTVPKVVW